jgi:hypothetical protein
LRTAYTAVRRFGFAQKPRSAQKVEKSAQKSAGWLMLKIFLKQGATTLLSNGEVVAELRVNEPDFNVASF